MIQPAHGNLLAAPVQAIVNPVNCVGAMGKGLALAFRKAFPGLFEAYVAACEAGEVQTGRIWMWTPQAGGPLVLCLPTKRHWREPSRLEDVEAGIVALAALVREQSITSIAIPALGCGEGGLDWAKVRPRIEAAFEALPDVDAWIFPPRAKAA